MIQAQDLRIGNWLETDDEFKRKGYVLSFTNRVLKLKLDHSTVNIVAHRHIKHLVANPIPLTPDILIAAGFEKYTSTADSEWKMLRFHKIGLEKVKNDVTYGVIWFNADDDYGTSLVVYISYLHELQNLFFCLTKTELKISL